MNVALIGSGGREHALALKISESNNLGKLFLLPGNIGSMSLGQTADINLQNYEEVLNFCQNSQIELVVIGPEKPLAEGLTDFLTASGIKVFGPSKLAAQIEGDKAFAKNLMEKYQIPTAKFQIFQKEDYQKAIGYIEQTNYPVVIKASGLAAGKGVLICNNYQSAKEAIEECFDGRFGEAGQKIVIEEFMEGEEASLFVVTDGTDYFMLPTAQDHKRIGDGDTGKNTGGMGAYAPAPLVTNSILKRIEETIVKPTLNALKSEDATFVGCLYCGLMIKDGKPKVVEFNCRFGDPETQVVLPILKGDFLELLYSAASGKLNKNAVQHSGGAAVCVVAASKGYPEAYQSGFEIYGLDNNFGKDIIIYHAGTKLINGKISTAGGRVLGITAFSEENDLHKCKKRAYQAIKSICYQNIVYRNDISDKA